MNTAPRHTATLTGALLAASLVLGACVEAAPSEEASDSQQAVSEADPAEDARQANQQRFSQLTLQELRAIYPTAGLEVPPAELSRTTQAESRTQDHVPTGRFARHPE